MKKRDKNTMLLLDLDDNIIGDVAEVIASKTCRLILKTLADGPKTETEISEELDLPLSTIHYNLQKLIKAGLTETKEFHYSKKGKEINHYQLSKKYVVISPRPHEQAGNLFKRLLTSLAIAVVALKPASILIVNNLRKNYVSFVKTNSVMGAKRIISDNVSKEAVSLTTKGQSGAANLNNISNVSNIISKQGVKGITQTNFGSSIMNNTYTQIGLFLLITLIIYLIIGLILNLREKRRRKE